jgi:hypothetical protein
MAVVTLACVATADWLRTRDVRTATIATIAAWVALSMQVVLWVGDGTSRRAALAGLARLSSSALVSAAVLLLYLKRSGVQDAGVHVDAVYTFLGAGSFLELAEPITAVGLTPSYAQFGLMLLSHLPAQLIGFERLGPLAINLGVMLTIAVLVAVFATRMVPGRLGMQLVTAGLASAVFSNRMLVMSHDWVGYTVPAVCLGLMFIAVVDNEAFPRPDTMVGGLLALALLHHLPAFAIVLPVCAVWVLVQQRLRGFVRANPILLTVLGMFVITGSIHPELVLPRVGHVTLGPGGAFGALADKLPQSWQRLTAAFPSDWYRTFLVEVPGSWFLLDVPPLGGLVLPSLAASYACSALALPGRALRYLIHLALFAALLVGLSLAQHLLTDFVDYRDFTAIIALMVAGLLFVLRAPRLSATRRAIAWSLAAGIATYNFVDVSTLRGRTHFTVDYAPRSQAVLERARVLAGTLGPSPFGTDRIVVALDRDAPLEPLYLAAMARRGVRLDVIRSDELCADRQSAIGRAASRGCGAFLLLEHTGSCGQDPAPRVRGELYESVCGIVGGDPGRRVTREVVVEDAPLHRGIDDQRRGQTMLR